MPVRRGVPSLVLVPLLLVVTMLAVFAPRAQAVSLDRVTGGESALFVPLQNVGELGRAGIFVSPIAPAYLTFTIEEDPAVRFPISGGAVESSTMLGTVNHAGGLRIQKLDSNYQVVKELDVTDLKIVAGSSLVGNALGLIPSPTADLINQTHSKNRATGVISYEADAQVSTLTATVLNTYFDTNAFKPGSILGHLKSTIQTRPLL